MTNYTTSKSENINCLVNKEEKILRNLTLTKLTTGYEPKNAGEM